MKICHISSGHYSESGRIFNRACRGLVESGHEVILIINHDRDVEEVLHGVRIIPITIRRGMRRYIFSAMEAYRKALNVNADIYHFHDPELLPWMVRLQTHGRRVVFDSHEHFTEVLRKRLNGNPALSWLPFVYHRYQRYATAQLSGLVAITDKMIDVINPDVRQRCAVGNFVNLNLFDGWQPQPNERKSIVATSGLITTARHCNQLVDALPLILQRHPNAILRLSGQFGPDGYQTELMQRASSHGVKDSLELSGYVTYRENIVRAAQASVGCAFFEPKPYAQVTLQNRLFEYMFCGVPVLVSAGSGVTETIVKSIKCGYVVDSLQPKSIAEATCRILDDSDKAAAMGRRGRQAVLDKFNFSAVLKDLIAFYKRILTDPGIGNRLR